MVICPSQLRRVMGKIDGFAVSWDRDWLGQGVYRGRLVAKSLPPPKSLTELKAKYNVLPEVQNVFVARGAQAEFMIDQIVEDLDSLLGAVASQC